ncbi:MAG: ABC transporter substrate-binding protein [Alkalispirochaeta sp.]
MDYRIYLRCAGRGIERVSAAILFVVLALVGCGSGSNSTDEQLPPHGETSANDSAIRAQQDTQDVPSLVVGLMPAVDTAPFFVAHEAGYFADEGVDVAFQLFTSGQDRQSALQTGRIDGAMTDLVAVAVNVAGGFDLKATMLTEGVFPIIVRPDFAENGESRVSIGLMEVSVTNFLADQWLASDYELKKVFINQVPARLEAVASGQLDMGVFPEPIASVGVARGLDRWVFDPVDGFSPDVIAFTGTAREDKRAAIAAFQRAYNRAAADIRDQNDLARDAIIANIPNLSAEIRREIVLPTYHDARLPDAAAVERMIRWTERVVAEELSVTADDLLDRSFLAIGN